MEPCEVLAVKLKIDTPPITEVLCKGCTSGRLTRSAM